MTNQDDAATTIWQGGHQMKLRRLTDRFAVRLKRGKRPDDVGRPYHLEHGRSLPEQRLDEFVVEPERRDEAMREVRGGDEVEFATHVYAPDDDPAARLYLTDEITVQFRPEVTDDRIEELTEPLGLEFVKDLPDIARAFVFRVGAQAQRNPIKIANELLSRSEVLVAEPNIAVPIEPRYVPADTMFGEQWHLSHNGGPFLAAGSHLDAVRAWDITRGERSVIVAVADDSVDTNHDDFQGTGKTVSPRDFYGRDFEPLPEAAEDNHGTACAGVAVAEENGRGVVGVAPGCALMPIRTTGILDDTSIEDLVTWVVERGAAVLSCSWGPAAIYFPLSLRKSSALHRAATAGRGGKGTVVLFAAGNANRPINGSINEQGWPNNQYAGPTRWFDGFAAHPDVITVAASTSGGKKSAYSNWGPEISICAPSNNARPQGTYPAVTVAAPGRGIVTTDRVGPTGYSASDYTRSFGGTSSACPAAAGVAALVLSANPDLTAAEVRDVLQSTADKIVDNDADPQLGNAFGAYDVNGHSRWFGFGKVNAFRAVAEAVRRRSASPLQTHRKASVPGLVIPDNNAAGVSDRLSFAEAVTISGVRVTLDITHTYIGDLRVTLTPPGGPAIVLHDRNGGASVNLQRSYDITSLAALGTLAGRSGQGEWTLAVQDVAARDVGRLNRWEIEIEGQQQTAVELTDVPGSVVPDNNATGITRSAGTVEAGQVGEVEIDVDITHTYIGDLIVSLVSPAGTVVDLHRRAGGNADNLIKSYSSRTYAPLGVLRGQAIAGQWQLRVTDLEAADEGKLNRWSLRLLKA